MESARIPLLDRYVGCLLGGAVGDALGAPVEFESLASIRKIHGPAGVLHMSGPTPGAFTDDTQMTLFAAEGLLLALREGADPVEKVHEAWLRWLWTQGETSSHPRFDPNPSEGLVAITRLRARCAPGATCLTSLRKAEAGTPTAPINQSKGCGGVMRAAPMGLARAWNPYTLGCATAALTHGHPSGWIPAGVFARLVREIVEDRSLTTALDTASAEIVATPDHAETLHALAAAQKLAAKGTATPEFLARLGAGWVGEEALAIGAWCALVARSFQQGVSLAVSHSGDSDSTGLVAGSLLGAMLGPQAIPTAWLDALVMRDEITAMATALYEAFGA